MKKTILDKSTLTLSNLEAIDLEVIARSGDDPNSDESSEVFIIQQPSKVSTKRNIGDPNKIRVGSSEVFIIQQPSKVSTKRNIKAGQNALARAMWKITKPGVVIKRIKDVPLYYADPNRKGIIIRERNGIRETGIFKNGKFKQCP